MKYFFQTFLCILVLSACNKTPPAATPTVENMLRKGKWKMSSGTIHQKVPSGRDTSVSFNSLIPGCHADDYIVFDSGTHGRIYAGALVCSAADPEYIEFVWQLKNDNTISFYNCFSLLYGDSIYVQQPYHLDTIDKTIPSFHTSTLPDGTVIDDTLWDVMLKVKQFADINIYNAKITNFSQQEFTLNYTLLTTYEDTTHSHQGLPRFMPVPTADTLKYSIKFTNF